MGDASTALAMKTNCTDNQMIRIRQAKRQDMPKLSELAIRTYVEAFGSGFSPRDLSAHLEKNLSVKSFAGILCNDTVMVAENEARMVGYLQFGDARIPEANPGKDKEVYRLYVLSEFQNAGIGKSLMTTVLSQFSPSTVDRVFLDVWENNPSAISFYRRFGFQPVGKRPFQVASGAITGYDLIMVRKMNE
jgi:ribosomal protein S18 acetylase RimI-like enzyme